MPSLRKTLIQLLTELGNLPFYFTCNVYCARPKDGLFIEFSGDSRNKEESARLLGHLIRSSQRLIKPYVEPILNALLPKLKVCYLMLLRSCFFLKQHLHFPFHRIPTHVWPHAS